MKVNFFNDNVILTDAYLDLEKTLFCGQAFRFKKQDGFYFGVVGNRVIKLAHEGNCVTFFDTDREFFQKTLIPYFDLERDYEKINASYADDEILTKGLSYAHGIRVLNQEPFETLISFIISANNNIGRITGIIDRLCATYGNKIGNTDCYTFPTPEILASLSADDFFKLGAGYRAPYILKTATMVNEGAKLFELIHEPYEVAIAELLKFSGVGRKVADCVALYSLRHTCAFPLDVWMKRVVYDIYKLDKSADVFAFIRSRFGEYAGIAQQYLFYYVKFSKGENNGE